MSDVTLNVAASVSRIRNRSRSTILRVTSGVSFNDVQQNDFQFEKGESHSVTAQNIMYGYIEDNLTVLMEFLDVDDSVTASVTNTMRGFISLPCKCKYTFTNPSDNTRVEPISVSLITA